MVIQKSFDLSQLEGVVLLHSLLLRGGKKEKENPYFQNEQRGI